MSKSSNKAKRDRDKRAYEQARAQGAIEPSDLASDESAGSARSGRSAGKAGSSQGRPTADDLKGVADRARADQGVTPTVGQIKMLRLMNLFRIAGVLILIFAVIFMGGVLSEDFAKTALAFIGYAPDEYALGSPRALSGLEGLFAVILGVLCLVISGLGRGWLRGTSSYGRFIVLVQISAGVSIFWFVVCLFISRFVEPLSGLAIVLFLVMLRVISRLHRESGL